MENDSDLYLGYVSSVKLIRKLYDYNIIQLNYNTNIIVLYNIIITI